MAFSDMTLALKDKRRPLVSILTPAYRPTWLNEAIASVLAQTYGDFEFLIGDDCPDEQVEALVSQWRDPRLRYFKNPKRGEPGSNGDGLIAAAKGEYIKFLFDDDLLYPRSVETLVNIAQICNAKLTFHRRDFIDANGTVIPDETSGPSVETLEDFERNTTDAFIMPPSRFFSRMIGGIHNGIGEPSNILIHTATLRGMPKPFQIGPYRSRFLADMALYANFFAAGLTVAASPHIGSRLRKHGGQASARGYAGYSAGIFEWDLLGRWAFDNGYISHQCFLAHHEGVMIMYQRDLDNFPELRYFVAVSYTHLTLPTIYSV